MCINDYIFFLRGLQYNQNAIGQYQQYISASTFYIHNMTCKTFLKQFTAPPPPPLPTLLAQDGAFFI